MPARVQWQGSPEDWRDDLALVDLHTHSSNSDGFDSPKALVNKARDLGLLGVVISDHSGITYSLELVEYARQAGVVIPFPAVEISTKHGRNKFHVLAYGPSVLNQEFREYAFRPTKIKNDLYREVINALSNQGYDFPPLSELLAGGSMSEGERHPGKWMLSTSLIAEHMVQHGYADAVVAKDLVKATYNQFKVRVPDRYLDTIEVIRRIREIRAVPVLAHPWWECSAGLNTSEGVASQIKKFKDAGILGIETVSRHQSDDLTASRAHFADDLGLLKFAGSDYHGNGKTTLGQYGVSSAELHDLDKSASDAGCELLVSSHLLAH